MFPETYWWSEQCVKTKNVFAVKGQVFTTTGKDMFSNLMDAGDKVAPNADVYLRTEYVVVWNGTELNRRYLLGISTRNSSGEPLHI